MPSLPLTVVQQLHPDVYSYLNRVRQAGGDVADHRISAINRFVVGCYEAGLRDRNNVNHLISYLWALNLTKTFAGCNVPIWTTVGNATLDNFVKEDWSSTGLIGNTTTKYANPNLSHSALTASDLHFGVWLRSSYAAGNKVCIGAFNGTTLAQVAPNFDGNAYYTSGTAGANQRVYTPIASPSLQIVCADATGFALFSNGVNINSRLVAASPISLNMYVFARNNSGSPGNYFDGAISLVSMGRNLVPANAAIHYQLINNWLL